VPPPGETARRSGLRHIGLGGGHGHRQAQRLIRERNEAEVLVERRGLRVLGIDDDRRDSDFGGNAHDALNRVVKEQSPNPCPRNFLSQASLPRSTIGSLRGTFLTIAIGQASLTASPTVRA
jgi:hypothetical protein